MKKVFFIIVFMSFTSWSYTMLSGDLARNIYDLIPTEEIFHFLPRQMWVKVAGKEVHCAKRIENFNPDVLNFSYKCRLPNVGRSNKIWLSESTSKIFFEAIDDNEIKKIVRGKISIEEKIKDFIHCSKLIDIENNMTKHLCSVNITRG